MKKAYLLLALFIILFSSCKQKKDVITILCWSGYNEVDFKDYIEEKIPNTELKFVTYTGGEDMLRKYLNNEDKYDLLVVDAEYSKILYEKNEIQIIDLNKIPAARKTIENDYFSKFLDTSTVPGYNKKGENYCLIVRWGTLGLVGKKSLKSAVVDLGYNVLLDNRFKGKITLFDWYLPNMGIFSLMYLNKNNIHKNPYDLTSDELKQVYEMIMKPMKPQINKFYADLGLVIQSAYDTNTDFIPGIGEWAIGNKVLESDSTRDWYIPKQGGIMWIEALSIPINVKNEQKLNKIYSIIELFTSSELQSKLAWRKAYTSQVPNKKAYLLMSQEQQKILKYNELDKSIEGLYFRKVPESNASEWIKYWSDFRNN